MIISKKDRLTACVMTSVFALSLLAGGCAQPITERSEESTGALAATAPCEPGDDDDFDDDDAPAPMSDDQIKELEGLIKTTPAPAPAPPPTAPAPSSPKAPAPKVEIGTRNTARMTTAMCCALGDSPRRAALKEAVKRRNEDYEVLAKKLGWGAILAAGAGYAAIQVKNGKPPTEKEILALGITLVAGVLATYYAGVLDIEKNYRRAYDEAMKLSNTPTPCDSSAEVSFDAAMAH